MSDIPPDEPDEIRKILDGFSEHVRWYILEGKTPVRATLREWSEWRCDPNTSITVAETIKDNTRVHTAFLGLDHGHHWDGKVHPPIIFETMIFRINPAAYLGFDCDGWRERCCTWEEAEKMHRRACRHAFGPALKLVGK